jgi:hypothetical protein
MSNHNRRRIVQYNMKLINERKKSDQFEVEDKIQLTNNVKKLIERQVKK